MSLPEDDVALLDTYARSAGLRGRSAVIQHALRLLRQAELEQDYAAAWAEWETAGHQEAWEASVSDGVADAPR